MSAHRLTLVRDVADVVWCVVCVYVRVHVRVMQSERDGRDADAGCDQHQLVFTVPHESESQMIEKVWAKAKAFVAKVDHTGRTPAQMRADLIEGLYGGPRCEGVTAADCQSYIGHALGTANQWLWESVELGKYWPPCVAPEVVSVTAITHAMRQQYRAAHPPPAVRQTVHSDSSATDDNGSDEDY